MNIHSEIISLDTCENVDVTNLTPQISSAVRNSGISNGLAIISSRHTTTALFINEFEQRLIEDIKVFVKNLVPAGNNYLHNDISLRDCPADEPENAHSHIMAMLLNSNEIIPVVNGALSLGQWQAIMLVELDGPRNRTVQVQILGNKE